MPNECKGNFKSFMLYDKLPTVRIPIGYIVIDAHTMSDVTGSYVPFGGSIKPLTKGFCTEGHTSGTHILRFEVKIGGELFKFRGVLKDGTGEIVGSFLSLGEESGPDPGDTGTWEASKDPLIEFIDLTKGTPSQGASE